ncbi:hypothetical protein E2C01_023693 [Portunus trituberculatus]|uniref:Uncharacterized protein n=1 Tax=Portunus trituberculatus TaxID=210409 RepID=A0A5B7EAI4_PORTR|nr:hypothetical protein [Portunus trituberculatus]
MAKQCDVGEDTSPHTTEYSPPKESSLKSLQCMMSVALLMMHHNVIPMSFTCSQYLNYSFPSHPVCAYICDGHGGQPSSNKGSQCRSGDQEHQSTPSLHCVLSGTESAEVSEYIPHHYLQHTHTYTLRSPDLKTTAVNYKASLAPRPANPRQPHTFTLQVF